VTPPPLTPSRAAQLRIGFALRRRLARLQAHDRLDPAGRQAWRDARLAELWRHAVARSEHYRDRRAAPPDRVHLPDLPLLDKSDLVHGFDSLVTVPGLRRTELEDRLDGRGSRRGRSDRYRIAISSGSSGSPAIVAFDGREWVGLIANAARARAVAGPRPGGIVRSAKVGSPSRWHLSSQVPATLSDPRKPSLSLSAADPIDGTVAELDAWSPTILTTYPSVLRRLLVAQRTGTLDLSPTQVFTSGEHLGAPTRELARAVWGVEIFDQYVATEVGFIAVQCPAHDGYHILDDHVVVEVVDGDGMPCPAGEEGEVLVTALHARTLPIIRYRIGDRAAVADGPCRCEYAGPRLASIGGADRDVLVFRARPDRAGGGAEVAEVHPVAITAIVDRQPVDSWIVRHDPDALRLEVTAPSDDFDRAGVRAQLADVLSAAGAHRDVDVRVEVVEAIEAGPGGKAARFRPLPRAPRP
jgi:phenylacetate-coenzyme A ligase PaaK-like adenylate-forming protein